MLILAAFYLSLIWCGVECRHFKRTHAFLTSAHNATDLSHTHTTRQRASLQPDGHADTHTEDPRGKENYVLLHQKTAVESRSLVGLPPSPEDDDEEADTFDEHVVSSSCAKKEFCKTCQGSQLIRPRLQAHVNLNASHELGFFVESAEAKSLFRGCTHHVTLEAKSRKPDFIVIGVQKGGTSSVKRMLELNGLCSPKGEPHFFDNGMWSDQSPLAQDVQDKYVSLWKSCGDKDLRFEKSPSYYINSWAPRRMCEVFGSDLKLVILLRNPINRAYSSFFHGMERNVVSLQHNAQGFDILARIEVALVKECGGFPSGDVLEDQRSQTRFQKCCEKVAERYGQRNWPGCMWNPQADGHQLGFFGHKKASPVRMGVYVFYMRNYFVHFPSERIAIYKSEDVFADMPAAITEMMCFAKPLLGSACLSNSCEKHLRSTTKEEPMWNSTANLLQDFYTPYNTQLDMLLGRKMNWW